MDKMVFDEISRYLRKNLELAKKRLEEADVKTISLTQYIGFIKKNKYMQEQVQDNGQERNKLILEQKKFINKYKNKILLTNEDLDDLFTCLNYYNNYLEINLPSNTKLTDREYIVYILKEIKKKNDEMHFTDLRVERWLLFFESSPNIGFIYGVRSFIKVNEQDLVLHNDSKQVLLKTDENQNIIYNKIDDEDVYLLEDLYFGILRIFGEARMGIFLDKGEKGLVEVGHENNVYLPKFKNQLSTLESYLEYGGFKALKRGLYTKQKLLLVLGIIKNSLRLTPLERYSLTKMTELVAVWLTDYINIYFMEIGAEEKVIKPKDARLIREDMINNMRVDALINNINFLIDRDYVGYLFKKSGINITVPDISFELTRSYLKVKLDGNEQILMKVKDTNNYDKEQTISDEDEEKEIKKELEVKASNKDFILAYFKKNEQ